jgi:hypothetical protein
MDRLCKIMHLTMLSHTCIFAIDHTEQGREEPRSQHQSRAVTMSMTKANSGSSNHHPCVELSIYILIMILGCALGDRS